MGNDKKNMELNSEQRRAVDHIDGPVLILAGAGSGKTATMTHRMAYMIRQGVDPRSILAVTFTNKAANEMRSRVADLVGDIYGMWIMTFHAMSLRMLRYSGEALGYRAGFTVYDETDKKALIKRICKDLGVDEKITPVSLLIAVISKCKEQEETPDDYLNASRGMPQDKMIYEVYSRYQQELMAANAMDFDDLLWNGVRLLEQEPDLFGFLFGCVPLQILAAGGIVPPDDFLLGCFHAGPVIHDTHADHVYAHIGRALVGGFAPDMLEKGVQDRENLNIPVIIDGGPPVSLQMKGIDHVHIAEVRGGSLIGDVDGVLQGQVPDRECFELGIAGFDTPAVFLIQLTEAGGHFAAAGTGGGDQHERAGRLHIIIAAEAFVTDNVLNIRGIPFDREMMIGPHALGIQPLLKGDGGRLPRPAREDNGTDIQPDAAEGINQAQGILVIGDAQIAADFAGLDIVGIDCNKDLFFIFHFQQHLHLAVRLEPRQDTAGVIIIEKLAAQFQIKLATELIDPLHNAFGLHFGVFVVIKADSHALLPPISGLNNRKYFTLGDGTRSRFSARKNKKRQVM